MEEISLFFIYSLNIFIIPLPHFNSIWAFFKNSTPNKDILIFSGNLKCWLKPPTDQNVLDCVYFIKKKINY